MSRDIAPPVAPDIHQVMLQLRLAEAIGWIVDQAELVGDNFEVSGWALSPTTRPEALRFLLNGRPFAEVNWPLPSPDVAAYFGQLPYAAQCRFTCRQPVVAAAEVFPDGYACLSSVPPHGVHQRTYRKSQYVLNPALEPPVPDPARIMRVIASDATSYRLGGASLAKRIDAYLAERFARPLASFAAVLDWGCGSGRVTRHLVRLCGGAVTGIDIDPDNIGWCRAALPQAAFAVGPLQPPLPCDDAAFDLAIAISVFTHLDEATQFRWLAELRRVVRPGGIVLASIHGMAQMAFYKVPSQHVLDVNERGFLLSGQNDQLDAVIDDKAYYKNVTQSHDYVFEKWSEYFSVCEIVEGMAANQDLVVLMRR
jgi:SAM-dependent methyltransferase